MELWRKGVPVSKVLVTILSNVLGCGGDVLDVGHVIIAGGSSLGL